MGAKKDLKIQVEYLTRVEGHGNIVINLQDGRLETCELQIIEAPRFFEAMVRGRSIFEVQHITSRICGICSIAHSLASIKAVEDALGFQPTPQTVKLRKLLLNLEMMDSHLLHIYFLVAPDAFGAPSAVALMDTQKDAVLRALRMKQQLAEVCEILAGRHTHPITCCVKGFTKLPGPRELNQVKELLLAQQPDVFITAVTLQRIKLPNFERETEYVALTHPNENAFLDGNLTSTDLKKEVNPKDYPEIVHEFHVASSTAKHAKNKRNGYMTGALARINLNYDKLHQEAKNIAQMLGFKVPCHNPYLNTVAQLVEYVHCYYDSLQLVEDFLASGINQQEEVTSWPRNSELQGLKIKPGRGVGILEAPRGILIHDYNVNQEAAIAGANCVIPTNQNLANVNLDLKKLVPEIIDKPKEEITLLAEMLVRAYDPCISCSTHFLQVDFKE